MSIKVLLADDHGMIRSGLRALLQCESDLEVVGEAGQGRMAVQLVATTLPQVVVMDLRMPEMNGIEAARQIAAAYPEISIIALSANADHQGVVEMLRAGAKGYVLKECAYEELSHAIRAVVKGKVYLSPAISNLMVEGWLDRKQDADSAYEALSPREREVLQLIAEGKATKEVAAVLHVSVKTAETHRRNLMGKLHLDSVAELTKYAIREGITGL